MTKPGVYEHWKGGLYTVLAVAHDSTNDMAGRRMVVYVSLTTGRLNTREETEFHQRVFTTGAAMGCVVDYPLTIPKKMFDEQTAVRFSYVGEMVTR